jgi:hypothetical protein
MDAKKALLYVSASAALGCGVLFAHLGERRDVERAHADNETNRRREAQERLKTLEHEFAAAASAPADTPAANAPPASGPPPSWSVPVLDAWQQKSRAAAEARRAIAKEGEEREARMFEDPQDREVVEAAHKADVRARNPGMARELGLSDDEYEQLLDLMIRLQRESVPFAEQSGEVAKFLGEEKAARFEAYKVSLPLRWQVNQFQSRLTGAGALTDAQAVRLTAALQSSREAMAEELAAQAGGTRPGDFKFSWYGLNVFASEGATDGATIEQDIVGQLQRYQERMRQSAASVLTAEQLRAYEQFLQDQLAMQRSQIRWRTARIDDLRGR